MLFKERPTRFGDDRAKDPNFYGQSRRKLPMEEATRERKRIGDYLSGKASQTMEMAKFGVSGVANINIPMAKRP